MKKLLVLAALTSTVFLGACDRKETVVVPPAADSTTAIAVPVPVPVPGPKGDSGASGASGATGATGATGAAGASGSTTVIVPPAAPADAPK